MLQPEGGYITTRLGFFRWEVTFIDPTDYGVDMEQGMCCVRAATPRKARKVAERWFLQLFRQAL